MILNKDKVLDPLAFFYLVHAWPLQYWPLCTGGVKLKVKILSQDWYSKRNSDLTSLDPRDVC